MFGRNKTAGDSAQDTAERPGAKNRPTPKRSVAQAANKRPLVGNDRKTIKGGVDRKTLNRASRTEVREARTKQRLAMLSGDDANLPVRDKGPQRRWVRDYVDARLSVGEIVVPLVPLFFVATLTRITGLVFVETVIIYGVMVALIGDGFWLRYRVRKDLMAKFGSVQPGSAFYAFTRSVQIRRWRLPRAQVKRREFPS